MWTTKFSYKLYYFSSLAWTAHFVWRCIIQASSGSKHNISFNYTQLSMMKPACSLPNFSWLCALFYFVLFQTNAPKAINIIAKLSFWIRKPFKTSIMEALGQFKEQGYVNKLKTQITFEVLPTGRGDLFCFLYDQIKNIWRFVMNYIFMQEKCLLLNPPRPWATSQSCQWHGFAKFLSFLY